MYNEAAHGLTRRSALHIPVSADMGKRCRYKDEPSMLEEVRVACRSLGDHSPFTIGGNRTHVAVPKNLLTTEALYHSANEILIKFDKYFGSRVV